MSSYGNSKYNKSYFGWKHFLQYKFNQTPPKRQKRTDKLTSYESRDKQWRAFADVVGGNAQDDDEEIQIPIEIAFTREQQQYALELDQKASNLRRSIHDLRLRIPPPHISQRLPHLHAHSLAYNAALALQLNAHSTTKEQAQLREVTLQEENSAYEKAISNCQKKIQEKLQEADLLEAKLKQMELIERNSKVELEMELATLESSQSSVQTGSSKSTENFHPENEASKYVKMEELDDKKKELSSMEERIQRLEEEWSAVQEESIKQPSPAQREKLLEKQLHSLVEQLTAKQAQAEGLIMEIRAKEREVERLNGLRRRIDDGTSDMSTARRNRFGRSSALSLGTMDYSLEASSSRRHGSYAGGRTEGQQRLMLLRSAFVLYIFALHVIVFIKISF
ncbi:uncharacterized protein LOC109842524 [Asparagus officinalis]|uniref:uncharacterized protein LOC109842524 n=1 Tax=Asparagus officinalis TaxID=4686 RepID=UPI00098E440C|nr:uncharacterized protein LOC109842524 [Asparagus officinalis]